MQASSIQQLSRTSAYDALQHVILKLATRPPVPRQAERSDEFKRLVEQALDAYRNYMKAVEEERPASKSLRPFTRDSLSEAKGPPAARKR